MEKQQLVEEWPICFQFLKPTMCSFAVPDGMAAFSCKLSIPFRPPLTCKVDAVTAVAQIASSTSTRPPETLCKPVAFSKTLRSRHQKVAVKVISPNDNINLRPCFHAARPFKSLNRSRNSECSFPPQYHLSLSRDDFKLTHNGSTRSYSLWSG